MSRYRKVDPRIWNDEKFRDLSNNGKLVFFMLLTHPHMTAIGAMRATVPGMAAEMGWGEKAFREAFGEVLSKGMARHDEKACFLSLKHFLKYNEPESPNVVKAWVSALDLLPECRLKDQAIQEAKAFAEGKGEAFGKAFPEALTEGSPKAMPYQEQEQEQEQENTQPPKPKASRKARKPETAMPQDFGISDAVRAWAAKKGIGNLEAHLEAFRLQAAAKGYTYADWDAAFQNAIRGNWAGLKAVPAQSDPFAGAL